jgi:hypothetical protein
MLAILALDLSRVSIRVYLVCSDLGSRNNVGFEVVVDVRSVTRVGALDVA